MIAAILLLAMLPFLPAIAGDAVFDDVIIHQAAVKRLRWRFPRVVTRWTHRLTWRSPIADHGLNIAVHAVNVGLVFHALGFFFSDIVRIPATIIFAVHPLQVFSVAYVAGRAGLLSFCAMAAAVNVLLFGSPILCLCVTPSLFVLGNKSKEDFFAYLPVIVFAVAWRIWG